MSDLEKEAHKAVLAVREMLASLARAEERLDRWSAAMPALNKRVEDVGQSMEQAADALVETAESSQNDLSEAEDALNVELEEVQAALADAGTLGGAAVQAEKVALDELTGELTQDMSRLEPVVTRAEGACKEAVARAQAVQGALAGALDEAERLLGELATAFANASAQVETASQEALHKLSEESSSILDGTEKDWPAILLEVRQLVDRTFDEIRQNVSEAAAKSSEALAALTDQQLDIVEADVKAVELDFEALVQALQEKRANLEAASTMVAEQTSADTASASALDDGLNEVRGRWATFGF